MSDYDSHAQAEADDTDPTLYGYRPCGFPLNEIHDDGLTAHEVVSLCLRDKGHLGPHLFGKPDREVSHLMGLDDA